MAKRRLSDPKPAPPLSSSARSESVCFGRAMRSAFLLDDGIDYINHGSFGAVPRVVLEAQEALRRDVERQPFDFMVRRLPGALDHARARLADFIGGDGHLVFVENATVGVNAVLRSIDWQPGERILYFDQVYGAIRQTLAYLADRYGVEPSEVSVRLPVAGPGEIEDAFDAALQPGIRLALIDHVASQTGLVLPIRRLIDLCHGQGIPVLVDGAHAPGQVDLDISALNPDWYVGNCHKWLFAPKGCGFLWVRPDRLEGIHPTVISHGYGKGLDAEFHWPGTRDFTAWLAVTDALDFLESQDPEEIRRYTYALAWEQANRLADAWKTEIASPRQMTAAMAAVRLPVDEPAVHDVARSINNRIWRDHGIEVPTRAVDGRLWARISAQIYNTAEDYTALAAVFGG